jgi:hypothetical protein
MSPPFSVRLNRRRFLQGLLPAILPVRAHPLLAASMPPPLFEQIPPAASGIHWTHTAGKSPQKHLPETSGAGCAFLDYDNDGWMDIYLVNSGRADFYTPPTPLRNALYRNNRDGTFTDVTEKAGVSGGGYGMGVAVGDYNNDGLSDIYVTQVGRNLLYRNNGDGTFTDVWFDYDNDGRLDLFVCEFVEFDKDASCGIEAGGVRHYCIPKIFKPRPSRLFHNKGDGTFTDVSRESGIADHLGKAWGVVAADLDNTGRMDLFVANDTVANFLFMNRGSGRFEENGFAAGVAYSAEGRARSGMGVDSADYDNDGWMDLFVSNIDEEIFSLYHNNHDGTFDDRAMQLGIGMPTRWMSGWGVKFLDYDNDGDLDLVLCNGFPDDLVDQISNKIRYAEPLLLFHNNGKSFQDVSAQAGPAFQSSYAARGLAIGDFNNDGAIDVLINVNDAAPLLLKNNAARGTHWLGVNLKGRKSNPDAVGARITWQAGDLTRTRTKVGGGSFLSAHDPRMILGIGPRPKLDWLEVHWPQPSGTVERFTNLPIDRYITITEASGTWS